MQSLGGPQQNNSSWNCPEELCSCYLFTGMKCTLVRFPMYVSGSSLAEIVNIKKITRISYYNHADEDLIVR